LGTPDQQSAYAQINALRGQCGFGLLAYNTNLQTAAQNSVSFVANNYAAHPDAYSHTENSAYPGYTGAQPADRDVYAGFSASYAAELLDAQVAGATTPFQTAVSNWLVSPYHLAGLMYGYESFGFATATMPASPSTVFVAAEGASASGNIQFVGSAAVATFPCSGTSIKSVPYQGEDPSPLPGRNLTTNPVGQSVYVHVLENQTLSITSMTMTGPGGVVIPPAAILTAANDPNGYITSNNAVFIPNTATPAGSYTVSITGTNNGTPFSTIFTYALTN
jgi:hypothetical protein